MQKMFAFINLKTFLPDCMKNRRTDTPVAEDIVKGKDDTLSDSTTSNTGYANIIIGWSD